jgi:hypothetical protein
MDIEITALKKMVSYRNIENTKIHQKIDVKEMNIIKEYDFFCINDIKINKIIEKIENHKDFFIPIFDIEDIKLRDIYHNFNTNMEISSKINKYVLITYHLENYSYFISFLKSLPNHKLFIYHLVDSYIHILNGLNLLKDNNICLFDLTNKNIIFDNTLKPKIINYELALYKETIKSDFLEILKKCDNYTLKPIEIHLLFYIYNNDIEYVSSSFIFDIIDNFINKMPFFDLFSSKYRQQYKEESIKYYKNFVNKPKEYIYDEILRFKYTWSNYSLSLIYLHIIGNTIKTLNIKNTILNKILLILNKNINPDPNKRENIEETIEKVNILFGEYNNWDFIKKISIHDTKYIYLTNKL